MPPDTAVVPPTVGAFSKTPTAHRGAPPAVRALLEDPPRGPGDRRGQRSREPGAATAEHDDIGFMVPRHGRLSLQLSSSDNCFCVLMTASFPRITTSSRWEMRLRHVGGDGAWR